MVYHQVLTCMCKHPVMETAHLISSLEQLYSIQYDQASVVRIHTKSKQYIYVCVVNVSTYGVLYSYGI